MVRAGPWLHPGRPSVVQRLGNCQRTTPSKPSPFCLDCGADVADWRERLLPVRAGSLAVTERGELALHVERDGVCDECGGERVEIRVEGRGLPGRAAATTRGSTTLDS